MNIARVPLLSSALLLGVAGVHAQGLTAPRVKSLPDIELPANINVPESGLVRVRVQIDADGGATVSSCDAERLLCDLVVDAIRNAEFEPATRERRLARATSAPRG
jgi:outer membrane biosynthesis protein TonB